MTIQHFVRGFLVSLVVWIFATGACTGAEPIRIADIQARLFLQYTGTLSAVTNGRILWNLPAGGGDAAEPGSAALIDVTLSGPSESFVGGRSVSLAVWSERTGKVLERHTTNIGIFGPAGRTHVGFWLARVGCEPLRLVITVASDSKTLRLPFKCGE